MNACSGDRDKQHACVGPDPCKLSYAHSAKRTCAVRLPRPAPPAHALAHATAGGGLNALASMEQVLDRNSSILGSMSFLWASAWWPALACPPGSAVGAQDALHRGAASA